MEPDCLQTHDFLQFEFVQLTKCSLYSLNLFKLSSIVTVND